MFTDYTDLYGHTKTRNEDRARGVFDEALKTLGGVDRLQTLTSITMRGRGQAHASAESQGYASEQRSTEEYSETLVGFPSQEKLAFEHRINIMSFFAKWLKDNRLAPERIYGEHSHGFATMKHVNKAQKGT